MKKSGFDWFLDLWLYRLLGKPFYFLMGLVGGVSLFVAYIAPVAYLAFGILYWLKHAQWLPYNTCQDLGLFCPVTTLDGLNLALIWIADHPFFAICLTIAIAIPLLMGILDSVVESSTRSRKRFEQKVE